MAAGPRAWVVPLSGPSPGVAAVPSRRNPGSPQHGTAAPHQALKPGGRGRRSAAVGQGAPQVGPKTGERSTPQQLWSGGEHHFLPGMVTALRPGLESNSSQHGKAGWIPQGGGRPRLWWVFGDFLPNQKVTPAERPRLGRWFPPRKSEKDKPCGLSPLPREKTGIQQWPAVDFHSRP